jgi:hypothetical protein
MDQQKQQQPIKKQIPKEYQTFDPNFDYSKALKGDPKQYKEHLEKTRNDPTYKPTGNFPFSGDIENEFPELATQGFVPKALQGAYQAVAKDPANFATFTPDIQKAYKEYEKKRFDIGNNISRYKTPQEKMQYLQTELGPEGAADFVDWIKSIGYTPDEFFALDGTDQGGLISYATRLSALYRRSIENRISPSSEATNSLESVLMPNFGSFGEDLRDTEDRMPNKQEYLKNLEARELQLSQDGSFLNTIKDKYQPKNKEEAKTAVVKEKVSNLIPANLNARQYFERIGKTRPFYNPAVSIIPTAHQFILTATDPTDVELDDYKKYDVTNLRSTANYMTFDDLNKSLASNQDIVNNKTLELWTDFFKQNYISINAFDDLLFTNKTTGKLTYTAVNSVYNAISKGNNIYHLYNGKLADLGPFNDRLLKDVVKFAKSRAVIQHVNKAFKDGKAIDVQISGQKQKMIYLHNTNQLGFGEFNIPFDKNGVVNRAVLRSLGQTSSAFAYIKPDGGWKIDPIGSVKASYAGYENKAASGTLLENLSSKEIENLKWNSTFKISEMSRLKHKEKWPKQYEDFVKQNYEILHKHIGNRLIENGKLKITNFAIVDDFSHDRNGAPHKRVSTKELDEMENEAAINSYYKDIFKTFFDTEAAPNVIASDRDIMDGQEVMYGATMQDVGEAVTERHVGGSVNSMPTPELLNHTSNITGFPARVSDQKSSRDPEETNIQTVATLLHETGHLLEGQGVVSPSLLFAYPNEVLDPNVSDWLKTNKPSWHKVFTAKTSKMDLLDKVQKRDAFVSAIEGQNSLKELYLTIDYLKSQNINGATMNNVVLNGYTSYMMETIGFIKSDPKLSKLAGDLKYPQDFGKFLHKYLFDHPDKNFDLIMQQAEGADFGGALKTAISKSKMIKAANVITAREISKHLRHVVRYPMAFFKGEMEGPKAAVQDHIDRQSLKDPDIVKAGGKYANYDGLKSYATDLPFIWDGIFNAIENNVIIKQLNLRDLKKTINILLNFVEGAASSTKVAELTAKHFGKDAAKANAVYDVITKFDQHFWTPEVYARHPNIKTYPKSKGFNLIAGNFFDKIFLKAGVEIGI